MPNVLNGSMLKLPYDRSYPDESAAVKKLMDESRFGMGTQDLTILVSMALYGGTDGWTRERIDGKFDLTLEKMRGTAGFEPGTRS